MIAMVFFYLLTEKTKASHDEEMFLEIKVIWPVMPKDLPYFSRAHCLSI